MQDRHHSLIDCNVGSIDNLKCFHLIKNNHSPSKELSASHVLSRLDIRGRSKEKHFRPEVKVRERMQ